jgi:hypothetical protein
MKRRISNSILSLLVMVVLTPFYGSAQGDVNQALTNIHEAYERYPNLKMDLQYAVYRTHSATEPVEVEQGTYAKSGEQFRFELSGVITVCTGTQTLQKDAPGKVIVVANQNGLPTQNGFSVSEMITAGGKPSALPNKGDLKGVLINFKGLAKSEISKAELYYNPKTFLVTEMVLYYKKALDFSDDYRTQDKSVPKMVIKYLNTDTKPVFKPGTFALTSFVKQSESGFELSKAHADYELIDLTAQSN